jgi:hypothetical protein
MLGRTALILVSTLCLAWGCGQATDSAAAPGGEAGSGAAFAGERGDGESVDGLAGEASGGASAGAPDGSSAGTPTGEGGATAQVRFVNAMFGCRSRQEGVVDYELYPFDPFIVDVYLEGNEQPLFVGVAPAGEEAATVTMDVGPVLDAAGGERRARFEVREAGTSPQSEPLLVSDPVRLPALGGVTLIAVGDPGPNADTENERALLLDIPPGDQGQLGAPQLRFVAASHQGHIKVLPGDDARLQHLTLEQLNQYSTTPPVGVTLGQAPLRLTVQGEDATPIFGGEATFSLSPTTFGRTRSALIIVTGLGRLRPADDPLGLSLLIVPEEPELGAVRVLQDPVVGMVNGLISSDESGSPVDVLVGSRTLAQNLHFAEEPRFSVVSRYNTEPFRVEGADGELVLKVDRMPLLPGKRYLGLLSGSLGGKDEMPPTALTFLSEEFPLDPFRRQARFIHAIDGVERLELGTWEVQQDGERGPLFTAQLGPVGYLGPSAPDGSLFLLPGETPAGPAGFGFFGVHSSQEFRVSELDDLKPGPSFLAVLGDWDANGVYLFQITPRQYGWPIAVRELNRL